MLLFFVCVALVGYFVMGYPLVLAFLARRKVKPVAKGLELRTVSFIIPVHNGARFLRRKLESILALDYPRQLIEILVVSDGSTDETKEIAVEFAAAGVQLLLIPR
jgi:cellulose synthase/poly-beta-1,6-N-acetylglucosamine synthase-like glycosyltransferase